MTEKSQAIGKRLRLSRQRTGLSQVEVAKYLNLSRPSVSEMEAGRRKLTAEELVKFAQIYRVPMNWLACADTDESDEVRDRRDLVALYLAKMSLDQLDLVLGLLSALRQMQPAK